MSSSSEALFASISEHVRSHGIQVVQKPLGSERPATFDGLSITLNPAFDLQTRSFYLVHSFGSIVIWSLDSRGTQFVFDELRESKKHKSTNPVRFAEALEHFRRFEEASSELAVGVLVDSGHAWVVPAYTNYFRADIASMLIFHKQGAAPVWEEFFADWNRSVASREKKLIPFQAKSVRGFTPILIPLQEVIQEIDGKP